MCLAVPGRIVEITIEEGLLFGKIDFGGIRKRVCLEYVQDAHVVGEYVLVHVGFALARIDEDEARRVFALLDEMNALTELADENALAGGEPS
jgi:hydrogenase expression/formation protein HypC